MTFANNTLRIGNVNTPCVDTHGIVFRMSEDQASRLKQARKVKYKSAAAACRAHGWVEATYRSHENGYREYDAEAAKIYGRAFGRDPAWLLGMKKGDMDNAAMFFQPLRHAVQSISVEMPLPNEQDLTAIMSQMLVSAGLEDLDPKYAQRLAAQFPNALRLALSRVSEPARVSSKNRPSGERDDYSDHPE